MWFFFSTGLYWASQHFPIFLYFIPIEHGREPQGPIPEFLSYRRMEIEGRAKVVASVWVAKFVQFLAALAVLSQSI